MGVLSATTAFGKTVISVYLIGTRKTNMLILFRTRPLLCDRFSDPHLYGSRNT